jgi:hypothetical protein
MSMKNSNRTHDLPACSAVPQPTTPPRAFEERKILVCVWDAVVVGAETVCVAVGGWQAVTS